MHNLLSFMGANFVARENHYQSGEGWDWGNYDRQTQDVFRPLATYREKISALLDVVAGAGFDAMDLWVAHLHPLWATPEHVAILREELEHRKIRLTSLAGGFGESLPEFRATCRLASSLHVRILGGGTPLLQTHRAEMVRILRDFGLIFALENHPEKTPSEFLAKLGDGDEDIMQVAVDTGWFGTQDYPADQALTELLSRTALVHLKDVKAVRAHDTCALGAGVVPVDACLVALREAGFSGPISIEHEPFDCDPVPDCVAGRKLAEQVLSARPVEISGAPPVAMAILGCGNIAATYAAQLSSYPEVHLTGVADLDADRAREFADRFGLHAYASPEELMADPEVEVVVNLTIHHAHYATIKACLEAGKHVHTEKPLALTSREAGELVSLAAAKDLRLSSAPTTWLGEAQQAARALIEAGRIGTPRVAYAEVNWGRIESWHPNPGPFYAVGPVFDVAVYPLTLLTAWFGPVRTVTAGGGIVFPHRTTTEGKPFSVESPDWSCAILEFASGLTARLTSSFYVHRTNSQAGLEVHGDLGSLRLSQWDDFGAQLEVGEFAKPMRPLALPRFPYQGVEYARGCRDLALALREGSPHRCTGAQAAHVVEICEAILQSVKSGHSQPVQSDFLLPK
jgi:predicted dehydrogenase/sugar phosphate isomerase/epimerase